VLVLHPARGISQRYCRPFAKFITGHGFSVVTYDYRGVGESGPARLTPDFEAGFRQLASKAGQVMAYVYHAFSALPLEHRPLHRRAVSVDDPA